MTHALGRRSHFRDVVSYPFRKASGDEHGVFAFHHRPCQADEVKDALGRGGRSHVRGTPPMIMAPPPPRVQEGSPSSIERGVILREHAPSLHCRTFVDENVVSDPRSLPGTVYASIMLRFWVCPRPLLGR